MEARAAALEAGCETTPAMATDEVLVGLGAGSSGPWPTVLPEQLKRLLGTVVEQILVESRACIQPYFVAPTVRTRIGSRRRAHTRTNQGIPSPRLWVTTRAWGRLS